MKPFRAIIKIDTVRSTFTFTFQDADSARKFLSEVKAMMTMGEPYHQLKVPYGDDETIYLVPTQVVGFRYAETPR